MGVLSVINFLLLYYVIVCLIEIVRERVIEKVVVVDIERRRKRVQFGKVKTVNIVVYLSLFINWCDSPGNTGVLLVETNEIFQCAR